MKKINKPYDMEPFHIFAKLHPVEAYYLRPDEFCEFARSQGCDMTDEQIKDLVDSCR